MADIYGRLMDGLRMAEAGKQESRRRGLADLMGKAYNAPADQRGQYLGQMAGIDPDAAFAAQKQFGGMDDDKRAQISRHAQIFDALPDEQKAQAYPQLAAEVRNLTGMPIPDAYDPKYLPAIQRIAGIGGGESFTLSPGSKRFGPDGKVIAEVPFAPASGQLVNVPDGNGGQVQMMFDPRTSQLSMPQYPGMPAPTTGGGGQVLSDAVNGALNPVQDFPQLASQFGAQVSSLARDPRHNAQVGGVGNSFHLTGEAGDFVVPANQRPSFIAAARARGYQAIDEGDHVHLEPPRRGMTSSQFAQGQRLGITPPKSETKPPSALEEKLDIARRMGASDDQLKQMVMGEVGGGKPNATMLRQANAAKQKLIDLNAIEQQLARVEGAFKPLQNTISATPYVGKFIPTEEGKRFDSTVSLLQGMVRKLTRTPGEGAMSDYETKLAQLANPSRSEYESVTAEQLAQLKELVSTMRQGYQAILEDNGGSSANIQPKAAGASDIDALLDKYK